MNRQPQASHHSEPVPKWEPEETIYGVRFKTDVMNRLRNAAKKHNTSRAKIIQRATISALEKLEATECAI